MIKFLRIVNKIIMFIIIVLMLIGTTIAVDAILHGYNSCGMFSNNCTKYYGLKAVYISGGLYFYVTAHLILILALIYFIIRFIIKTIKKQNRR